MKEIWKDIIGYEGMYQVSNLGNVKSLDRIIWNGHVHHLHKGRIMKPKGKKYTEVILCKEGKMKKWFIHRLVAIHFITNPNNKPQVNHLNGVPDDNRLENLEWCTQEENMQHAWENGLLVAYNRTGKNNPNYKHGKRMLLNSKQQ